MRLMVASPLRFSFISKTSSLSWMPHFTSRRFAAHRTHPRRTPPLGKSQFVASARKPSASSSPVSPSTKASAAGPTMRISRFYRTKQKYGFGLTMYLYIFGESMTLGVLYVLHSDLCGIGDTFNWLHALSADRIVDLDKWAHWGPTVLGLQFTPRLWINYLLANAITYPLFSVQVAFCVGSFAVLQKMLSPFKRIVEWQRRRRRSVVPKAPSVKNGDVTKKGNATKVPKSRVSITK